MIRSITFFKPRWLSAALSGLPSAAALNCRGGVSRRPLRRCIEATMLAAVALSLASCGLGDDGDRMVIAADEDGGGAINIDGVVTAHYRAAPVGGFSDLDDLRLEFTLDDLPDADWLTAIMGAGGAYLVGGNLVWSPTPVVGAGLTAGGASHVNGGDWNMFQTKDPTRFMVTMGLASGVQVFQSEKGKYVRKLVYNKDTPMPGGTVKDWVKTFRNGVRTTGVTFRTGSNTNYVMSNIKATFGDVYSVSGWTHHNADQNTQYYVLDIDESIGDPNAANPLWGTQAPTTHTPRAYIDAKNAQSTTTAPDFKGAKIVRDNPLMGIALPRGVTMSCKMKTVTGKGDFLPVIGLYGTAAPQFFFIADGGTARGNYNGNDGGFFDTTNVTANDGDWHDIALTVTGDGLVNLYTDGVDTTQATATPPAPQMTLSKVPADVHNWVEARLNGAMPTFAISTNAASFWQGSVAAGTCVGDIRIYDRALNPSEIRALAQ